MGYQQMDDRELAHAALTSEAAFGEVIRRYYGCIYLSALAMVRQREMAEDIAQETFLRGWLRRDALKASDRLLQPWLIRIARNLAIDWLRTGQQRSRVLPLISMEEITVEPADNTRPDPRQAAGRADEKGQLTDAVMALPDDLRQAVLLHYAEGMSPSDIARLNGEAPSTVTRRLDKARQLLRQHLESGLAANLAASVQGLRPGNANLQRALGIITAATALPAVTRAQLHQLVADTPPPPLIDPVTSAATTAQLKGTGIMKTIIAKAGAGKLLAAGAAGVLIISGTYSLNSLIGFSENSSSFHRSTEIKNSITQKVPATSIQPIVTTANSTSERYKAFGRGLSVAPKNDKINTASKASITSSSNPIIGYVTVTGMVYDEATSEPLGGALIRAVAPGSDMRGLRKHSDAVALPTTFSTSSGRYEIQVPLTSGSETLSIDAFLPGYRSVSGTWTRGGDFNKTNIPVTNNQILDLDLVLPEAIYVAGKVVDQYGKPVSEVEIKAMLESKRFSAGIATTSTDPDGLFEIYDYPFTERAVEGPYMGTVTFKHADLITTTVPDIYSLNADELADIKVVMSRGHSLAGQLLFQSGSPAPDIKLHVKMEEAAGSERRDVTTDRNGYFNLNGLPPGNATLYAGSLELGQRIRKEISLPVDGDLTISMESTPTVDLSNAVTVLGMRVIDVDSEIANAYDLYTSTGVLILDPGPEALRLKLSTAENPAEFGDQVFLVGNTRIANIDQLISEILRINEIAEPSNGQVDEGHTGYVRIAYNKHRYKSHYSMTSYLELTPADIKELSALLSKP